MRIREAAQQSGVAAPTIRYYEKLGLLDSVVRTAAGYREFSDRDVQLLIFLRKARDLGFSLQQCQELLDLVASPVKQRKNTIDRTRKLAKKRVADIDKQISDLAQMRQLVQLHIDHLDEHGTAADSSGASEQACPVTRGLRR
jgi:DNA-binding transcriptional MerR regulator